MNEETIKKLIQLNDGQQRLLDNVINAVAALDAAGVMLILYDSNLHAINVTAFKQYMEIDNGEDREEYERDGFVSVPFWKTPFVQNYISELCLDDALFAVIDQSKIDCDRNLFNQ